MAAQFLEKLPTPKAAKWHNTTQYFKEFANDAPSAAEELFGMSEADLAKLVGRLENAVETITTNSTEQAKSIKDIDKRLTSIETKIQFASWVRWIFISLCVFINQFWGDIAPILKKMM